MVISHTSPNDNDNGNIYIYIYSHTYDDKEHGNASTHPN